MTDFSNVSKEDLIAEVLRLRKLEESQVIPNVLYKSRFKQNNEVMFCLTRGGQVLDMNTTAQEVFMVRPLGRKLLVADLFESLKMDYSRLLDLLPAIKRGESHKVYLAGISPDGKGVIHNYEVVLEQWEDKDVYIVYGGSVGNVARGQDDVVSLLKEFEKLVLQMDALVGPDAVNNSMTILADFMYKKFVGINHIQLYLFQRDYGAPQQVYQVGKKKLEPQLLIHYQAPGVPSIQDVSKSIVLENLSKSFRKALFVPVNIKVDMHYGLFILPVDDVEDIHPVVPYFAQELKYFLGQKVYKAELEHILHQREFLAKGEKNLLRITNESFQFTYLNDLWRNKLTRKNKIISNWLNLVAEADQPDLTKKLSDNFPKKKEFAVSYSLSEDEVVLEERYSPYFDEEGRFLGYIAYAKTSNEVNQELSRIEKSLNKCFVFALTIDGNGHVTYANRFFKDITGWSDGSLLDKKIFQLVRPEYEALEGNSIKNLPSTFEGELITRNGEYVGIRFHTIPFYDEHGYLSSVLLMGDNISEQMKVTQALHDNNRMLQSLFDSTNDMILIFNEYGKMLYINNAVKECLGYSDVEMMHLDLKDLIAPGHYFKTLESLQLITKQTNAGGKPFKTMMITKSGKELNIEGSIDATIKNGKDHVFQAILQDHTEQLRAEKAQNLYIQISKLIENSTPLPVLFEKFYRLLDEAIGVDSFMIALENADGEIVSPFYVNPEDMDDIRAEGLEFAKYALQLERPMFMYNDVIERIVRQQNIHHSLQLPKVWLGVPLQVQSRMIGMIVVQSFKSRKDYNKHDLELLNFISGQLASAILRQQNEIKIRQQAARLESIYQSGSHLMWSVNRLNLLVRFNHSFENVLNNFFSRDIHPGEDIMSVIKYCQMGNFEEWRTHYERAFKGVSQQFEMGFHTFNGEEQWVEVFLDPITDSHGLVEEVSAIANIITQKKIIEIGLAENEEKFRNIFESFQDLYFRINLRGVITMISPSVYELIGETPNEILGKSIQTYYKDKVILRKILKQLLIHDSVKNFESEIFDQYGRKISIISNFRLMYDNDHRPVSIEGVARDITELKKATEELREAKDLAEKSLEVKRSFLSNMSHEIRTPMNGIIGVVDLLMDTPLDTSQNQLVSTIKKSSETLLNILNDILDLSKIEAGRMELRVRSFSLHRTIDKLHALYAQQAHVKQTRLVYDIEEGLPDIIRTDETRLLQVLSNLTSNAIKFTENGTVSIRITSEQILDDTYDVRFEVQDSGIGISKESMKLLFQQFSQVDDSYTKSYGGTGLGLAISKELCRLMGGDIGVESEVGKGSTFWFRIKIEEGSQEELEQGALPERDTVMYFTEPPRVLIIDDNPVNLQVGTAILAKSGCNVTSADGGLAAIEKATNNIFDIILMDIQMPEVNGIMATKEIKLKLGDECPPIIAMTAFTLNEERQEFLNAGMDDFLSKPIKAVRLIDKVMKWTGKGVSDDKSVVTDTEVHSIFEREAFVEAPTKTSSVVELSHYKIVNKQKADELSKYGGQEIIEMSYVGLEEEMVELMKGSWEALETNDIPALKGHLHTIKGTAGTLGVERLSKCAEWIESDIKKEVYEHLAVQIEQLDGFYKEFLAHYKTILNIDVV